MKEKILKGEKFKGEKFKNSVFNKKLKPIIELDENTIIMAQRTPTVIHNLDDAKYKFNLEYENCYFMLDKSKKPETIDGKTVYYAKKSMTLESANLAIQKCIENDSYLLDLSYCGITDLNDLENFDKCTNVSCLVLDYNNITDLSPLKKLPKIDELFVAYNNVTKFAPLRDMKNLSILCLKANKIEDITELISVIKDLPYSDIIDIRKNSYWSYETRKQLYELYATIITDDETFGTDYDESCE